MNTIKNSLKSNKIFHNSNSGEYTKKTNLNFLVGQDQIKKYLTSVVDKKIPLSHMLFYGPPGVGKTSSAVALAKDLLQDKLHGNFLELNASNDRGIDTIRGPIVDFARSISVNCKSKLVLLDEAEYLTNEAQAALRRIMEKWGHNTKFILTTNNINKIDSAIRSRCVQIFFGRLKNEIIQGILRNNGVTKTSLMVSNIDGDYRKLSRCLNKQYSAKTPNYDNIIMMIVGLKQFSESVIDSFCELGPKVTVISDLIIKKLKTTKNLSKKLEVYSELSQLQWKVMSGARLNLQLYHLAKIIRVIGIVF